MDTATALTGIRHEIQQDTEYSAPSRKQRQLLASLMGQALRDESNRVHVLREIVGLEKIDGARNLTRGTVSILIDYLLGKDFVEGVDEYKICSDGRELIEYVESRLSF